MLSVQRKICIDNNLLIKQCRLRSDYLLCAVWSLSKLSAKGQRVALNKLRVNVPVIASCVTTLRPVFIIN